MAQVKMIKEYRLLTSQEETANVVTHGLGLLASLIGIPILSIIAWLNGDTLRFIACLIFGVTLIALYAASTIYHFVPPSKTKDTLQIVDHAAIFLLIAGSYTPFTLGVMGGIYVWIIMTLIWVIAIGGVIFKAIAGMRFWRISVGLYLLMGWMAVLIAPIMIAQLPPAAFGLLIAGGLCYTAGVPFFMQERMQYAHAIWHLFVIGGSAFHYMAVLFYAT
jgi:hemolysin III